MRASVVVPTYNRVSILRQTLQALLEQSAPSDQYEIIVVDDASTDGTGSYVASLTTERERITVIRHQTNLGRSATRNDGINAARGDIIIFLDDDNVPDESLVDCHMSHHARAGDEHIAVMGDVSLPPQLRNASNFARYIESRYLGHRPIRLRSKLDYDNLPARCFGTLNCSARKSDLAKVGMFDPAFRFYGGEDEYLGFCLKRENVRIVFGAGACSTHYDDFSLARYRRKMLETAGTGYRLMLRKAPGYFEQTEARFLLPIDWRVDRPRLVVKKAAIRLLANGGLVFLLEQWAALTDGHKRLYCSPIYRLLTAAWLLRGLQGQISQPLVTYNPDPHGGSD